MLLYKPAGFTLDALLNVSIRSLARNLITPSLLPKRRTIDDYSAGLSSLNIQSPLLLMNFA